MNFASRIAGFIGSSIARRPRLGAAVAVAVLVPLLLWGQSTQWAFSGGTASVTGVNVGIGTTNPIGALTVNGNGYYGGSNTFVTVGPNVAEAGYPRTEAGMWYDGATNALRIEALSGGVAWRDVVLQGQGSGNVGIGTLDPQYPLSVNGIVQAKEVLVNTGWSDYVFDSGYRLRPLSEVASYI
jgi:hypothetical protein